MALILKHILMETAKLPQSRLLNVLAKFGVGFGAITCNYGNLYEPKLDRSCHNWLTYTGSHMILKFTG